METGNKLEPTLQIVDEKSIEESKNLILFGEIGLESFKASLYIPEKRQVVALYIFEHARMPNPIVHANKLGKILTEYAADFRSSKQLFSVVNQESSLVPSEFYDPMNERAILEFSHRIYSSDISRADRINVLDSYNIWSCPSALKKTVSTSYPEAKIVHFSTPLLLEMTSKMEKHSGRSLSCHVQENHFEIFCFEDSRLQLYNSFRYQSPEDFLYYILFAMEQCNMNPEEHKIQLFGNIRKADTLYSVCYKYIRHVEVANTYRSIQFASALRTSDNHPHINLFNLHHCE